MNEPSLHFVTNELGKILQEGLTGVDKQNIVLNRINFAREKQNITLPMINVYDLGFQFEDFGFGAGFGENREQRKEEFSGDAKRTLFRLQEKPIRPLISVEAPKGFRLKESDDFVIDYLQGTLNFRSPLPKGRNNLTIVYSVAKSAAEVEGIKLKITCCIDVWAKNSQSCDSIAIEAMKSLLLARHTLVEKHIFMTPIRGTGEIDLPRYINLTQAKADGKFRDALGRRLLYLAETIVKIELKTTRIEKIEITSQK